MIPFQFLLQNSIELRFFIVYELSKDERERATRDITEMLGRGELVHNVAQTFALGDIVAAHEAVESGKATGNIVVRVTQPA
jgi:NADPH2:quinone reductase